MNINITQVIGIEESVKLICRELEVFAAPNKLPDRAGQYENYRRLGNVEMWFSPKGVGIARFHCATYDNINIDVQVDFSEMSREYLQDFADLVQEKINAYRAQRATQVAAQVVAERGSEKKIH